MKNILGGIPSPNPSYPQNINVVTGTQTINIKNGNDEVVDTVTLHLGTNEFCKIGMAADELLLDLDNDKVYKLSKIEKEIFTGTSDEDWDIGVTQDYTRYSILVTQTVPSDTRVQIFSNYFYYMSSGNNEGGAFVSGSSNKLFVYTNSDISSVALFKTWLSTHNTIVYYPLATPTLTEIEDEELKADLYELYASQSIEGTTIIETTGNLPIRLKVSALKQLS